MAEGAGSETTPHSPGNDEICGGGARAASLGMVSGSARGRVSPGPQATLEQRLALLEGGYNKLFDEVGSLGIDVKRRSDELSGKLYAEATAREASDKNIEAQVKETAVGSLHLDFWGVEFLILGTIVGTISQEVAAMFGAAWCKWLLGPTAAPSKRASPGSLGSFSSARCSPPRRGRRRGMKRSLGRRFRKRHRAARRRI